VPGGGSMKRRKKKKRKSGKGQGSRERSNYNHAMKGASESGGVRNKKEEGIGSL